MANEGQETLINKAVLGQEAIAACGRGNTGSICMAWFNINSIIIM